MTPCSRHAAVVVELGQKAGIGDSGCASERARSRAADDEAQVSWLKDEITKLPGYAEFIEGRGRVLQNPEVVRDWRFAAHVVRLFRWGCSAPTVSHWHLCVPPGSDHSLSSHRLAESSRRTLSRPSVWGPAGSLKLSARSG
jgi:hypothetical protein